MATGTVVVLTQPFISIDATQFEDQITSLSLPFDVALNDITTFSSGGWEESKPGLKSANVNLDILNFEGSGELTTILWTAFNTGASVALVVRGSTATIGADNPSFTYTAYLEDFNPVSGSVGDNNATSISFKVSGSVARAVA